MDNNYIDEKIDYIINEAKTSSQRKITRGEKISRAVGNLSIKMAKQNNDSLYKKYKKHRDLYKDLKAKIIKKYGPKVRSQARK